MLDTNRQVSEILEKTKEIYLEFCKWKAEVLQILSRVEYSKVNDWLADSQLYKLKSAAKNQREVTLGMTIKIVNRDKLSHELLWTTKQKTKTRNTFEEKHFNLYKAV